MAKLRFGAGPDLGWATRPASRCFSAGRAAPRARVAAEHNGGHPNGATHHAIARRSADWERKSDIYILRSDGFSCNRETVTGERLAPAPRCSALNILYNVP